LSWTARPEHQQVARVQIAVTRRRLLEGRRCKYQMQRIYGTAFFSQEELDAWLKQREEPRSGTIAAW